MDDRAVDQLVRSALAAASEDAGPHPDPDTLFQYYAGELGDAETEHVRAHVAACPECGQVVLDFETYPHLAAPSDEDVPTADQVDAGWADVQARLARETESEEHLREGVGQVGEKGSGDSVVVPLSRRAAAADPIPRTSASTWQALAATLAVATVGLGFYVVRLHRSLTEATGPAVNVHVADLLPEDELVRDATGPRWQAVRVPPRAPRVVLLLSLVGQASEPSYRAEIVGADATPRVIWGDEGVVRNAEGRFSIELRQGFLPAGRYRLRLSGASGEPVAEYTFQIDYE